jgi:hypothetical protein
MTVEKRALLIAVIGPAIQAIGIAWEALHIALYHLHEPLTARHIIFEPGVLVILVGFAVTVVCLPVALEVTRAQPDDVEIPVLGAETTTETGLAPGQASASGH